MNNFISHFKKSLISVALLGSFFALAQGVSTPSISFEEKTKFKSSLEQTLNSALQNFLMSKSAEGNQRIFTEVTLGFNENKLQQDYRAHESNQDTLAKQHEQQQRQYTQQLIDTYSLGGKQVSNQGEPQTEGQKELKELEDSQIRFGDLNIDLDITALKEVMRSDSGNQGNSASKVAINIPTSIVPYNRVPFTFNISNYLSSLDVSLFATEGIEDVIKDDAKKLAEKVITQLFANITPNVTLMPLADSAAVSSATPKDWINSLWEKSNATVGTIISSAVIGMLAVLAAIVIALSVGKLGSKLKNLTVNLEKSGEEGGADAAAAQAQAAAEEEAKSKEVTQEDSNLGQLNSQLLTNEISTIKNNIKQAIETNIEVFAGLIDDLFATQSGIQKLGDLICFIGYADFKPVFDILPPELTAKLEDSIEKNKDVPPSLANAVSLSQQLYKDIVGKSPSTVSESGEFKTLRKSIINLPSSKVGSLVADLDEESLSLLLMVSSEQKSNAILKAIDNAKLPLVLAKIDAIDKSNLPSDKISNITGKIEKLSSDGESVIKSSTKFVMRFIDSISIDNEKVIEDIINKNDWDMRLKILEKKFFLKDLAHVPMNVITELFKGFDIRFRANLLILVDAELKAKIIASYEEGSKQRDMIDNEIQLVESTPEILKATKDNRIKTISRFLDKVKGYLHANESIRNEYIVNICKHEGIETPSWAQPENPQPENADNLHSQADEILQAG